MLSFALPEATSHCALVRQADAAARSSNGVSATARAAAAVIVAAAVVQVPRLRRSSTRWRAGAAAGVTLATVFESRASALAHAPRFYDRATADAMFDEISQYAGLNFTSYLIEGARVRSPRRMMWCAADGVGRVPVLGEPRARVARSRLHADAAPDAARRRKSSRAPFNAVLINLYADGSEHAAWHSDDDPWLGKDFDVPSLARRGAAVPGAAPRRRQRDHRDARPRLAARHERSLPARLRAPLPRTRGVGVRINLTWRYIAPALRHLHNLKPRWDSDASLPERLGDHVPCGYFDDSRGRDR